MSTLEIGISLSDGGRTGADRLTAYARHAEDVGLDSVFIGDHLVAPRPLLESVVTLATAAAVTEQIRVGFGVMVVPLRPVAWVAKQVATLQAVSRNRVILGVGAGGPMSLYGPEAWDAVSVPFAGRGGRLDDALELLPNLIAGRPTRLSGTELTLAPGVHPPPIWVGGMSDAAMRRAARHGDAWFPSMLPPEKVGPAARRLADLAEAADQTRSYGVPAGTAARIPIAGDVSEAAERFAAYAEAGVAHLVLGTFAGDWRRQCELIAEARALLD